MVIKAWGSQGLLRVTSHSIVCKMSSIQMNMHQLYILNWSFRALKKIKAKRALKPLQMSKRDLQMRLNRSWLTKSKSLLPQRWPLKTLKIIAHNRKKKCSNGCGTSTILPMTWLSKNVAKRFYFIWSMKSIPRCYSYACLYQIYFCFVYMQM